MVRDYWTQLEVILDYESPGSGIMETSWVEVDSELETRHKYRVIIEPGLHSGYSEIYVLHMENLRSESVPVVLNWPDSSTSPDREREVMTSVSQYLADRNDLYQASSSSLLAGSIEAERKANIVETEQGDQILELRLGYDRAWALVRTALEKAEIDIVDSDRDQSFFNVRFAGIQNEEDERGFISRIFNRGEGDGQGLAEEKNFSVRLLETGATVEVVAEALEASGDLDQLMLELLEVISDNLS